MVSRKKTKLGFSAAILAAIAAFQGALTPLKSEANAANAQSRSQVLAVANTSGSGAPKAGSRGTSKSTIASKGTGARKPGASRPVASISIPISSELTPDEKVNISVYQRCYKAVVNIAPMATPEDIYYMGHDAAQLPGIGSGVVIDGDGYVATNFHVVQGAEVVRVTFYDGMSLPAKVVGVDPSNDLAVVKIDSNDKRVFDFVEVGDSSKLQVGRRVFAIGDPFGLDHTLTAGIISSMNRSITTQNGRAIKGVIQTDAAINPGNSGGPLLDTQAKLVGINTAIKTQSGVSQSAGIGFAIPANIVKIIIPQLIKNGRVIRPEIGFARLRPTQIGLQVIMVEPGGPAAKAGLQGPRVVNYKVGRDGAGRDIYFRSVDPSLADIVQAVDNIQVRSIDDLYSYIEKKEPNQVVNLSVLRMGKVQKIPVKLTVTRTD